MVIMGTAACLGRFDRLYSWVAPVAGIAGRFAVRELGRLGAFRQSRWVDPSRREHILDSRFSDRLLDCNEIGRPKADPMVLSVAFDVPIEELAFWEIVEDGKPYREWCIPAAELTRLQPVITPWTDPGDFLGGEEVG
jgi:hypothetical protein